MKKFFITTLLSIFIIFNSNAEIVIVDINYIFKNSEYGKKLDLQIKDLKKKKIEILKKKNEKLNDEQTKLISKKNVLSQTEFNKNSEILKKKILQFDDEKKKFLKEINDEEKKNYNNFANQMNNILLKYAKDNDIDLVLDKKNIVMSKESIDITQNILELLNK